MKRPDLREALLYDGNGKCIGFKDDKDIPPEVRAAWDKMLSESADRMESEYKAIIEAAKKETGGNLVALGDWGLCLAEMVREGIAPQAYYDTFRAGTLAGIPPLLPSDIATELYDRVEKRLASRTTLPEGMSDLEHAWSLLDAERATEENASVRVNTKAKRVASTPAARAAKKVKQSERDQDVLAAALAILSKTRARTNWTDLAQAVGKWLKDPPRDWVAEDPDNRKVWKTGTSRSSICARLERVIDHLPQTKIGPWKKVSGD